MENSRDDGIHQTSRGIDAGQVGDMIFNYRTRADDQVDRASCLPIRCADQPLRVIRQAIATLLASLPFTVGAQGAIDFRESLSDSSWRYKHREGYVALRLLDGGNCSIEVFSRVTWTGVVSACAWTVADNQLLVSRVDSPGRESPARSPLHLEMVDGRNALRIPGESRLFHRDAGT